MTDDELAKIEARTERLIKSRQGYANADETDILRLLAEVKRLREEIGRLSGLSLSSTVSKDVRGME